MNKAIIIGRVDKGGVKFSQDETECRFKLRVDESYKDKTYTQIINVYASGNNANEMKEMDAGDLVFVKGMSKTGKFERNGKTIYYFEVVCKEIHSIAESGAVFQEGLDQNEVVLIGRLGDDPKVFKNGKAAMFSMACDEYDGKQESTQWLNISTFNGSAKAAGDYLTKGRLVAVEGKIKTREYEKDGQTKQSTNIVANKWKALDANPKRREGVGNSEPVNHASTDDDIPF